MSYRCKCCKKIVDIKDTKPEEMVLVTCDMAGAELRIIAEDSGDPGWIGAFLRDEDLHSVGAEAMYSELWPKEALPGCSYFTVHTEETVAKNPNCVLGDPMRRKCKCPLHAEKRNIAKAPNFLLAYGGGPSTLAVNIKKSVADCKIIMALHEKNNTPIWRYLDKSGKEARMKKKAFDLFGRRRIFPVPTRARAIERVIEFKAEKLLLDEDEQQQNIYAFQLANKREPNKEELYELIHRKPNDREISNQFIAMESGVERQGKNHRIQGTNASIAKIAMGCGYDKEGKPFLWHLLPQYKAKLVKFVHDELVVQCPKRYGKIVAELIGDAFRRASALKMFKVQMEFDYNIATYWKK